MSYLTIAACVIDADMTARIRAAVADEGGDPDTIASSLFWTVAAADDIEAAYASALAAENPRPGADEAVVTDQMILGVVQANMPP